MLITIDASFILKNNTSKFSIHHENSQYSENCHYKLTDTLIM